MGRLNNTHMNNREGITATLEELLRRAGLSEHILSQMSNDDLMAINRVVAISFTNGEDQRDADNHTFGGMNTQ